MRRRLDIPPWPFADVAEPNELRFEGGDDGEELAESTGPPIGSDYLARARWQAGAQHLFRLKESDAFSVRSGASDDAQLTRADARRAAARLEGAITELRIGAAGDEDGGRRQAAEALMETYASRLDDVRTILGPTLTVEEADDDELFVYRSPASSRPVTPHRSSSIHSHLSTGQQPDLTPSLTLAQDFRVPTHESAPPRPAFPSMFAPMPHVAWQPDEEVSSCPECRRRFTLFVRRHHCRHCAPSIASVLADRTGGRVVCDNDSRYFDPIVPRGLPVRTCQRCHDALVQPSASAPLTAPSPLASSETSEISECPVCATPLAGLDDGPAHLQRCLDGNTRAGTVGAGHRFAVYRLPATSPLIGTECVVRSAAAAFALLTSQDLLRGARGQCRVRATALPRRVPRQLRQGVDGSRARLPCPSDQQLKNALFIM